MSHIIKKFILIVFFLFSHNIDSYTHSQKLNPVAIKFKEKTDSLSNIYIGNKNNVWISSNKKLWVYNAKKKQITPIKNIRATKNQTIQKIKTSNTYAFVLKNRSLEQIYIENKKIVHHYRLMKKHGSKSLDIVHKAPYAYWLTSKGYYKINYKERRIISFKKINPNALTGLYYAVTTKKSERLWWSQGKRLHSCLLKNSCKTIKKNLQLNTRIKNIKTNRQHIFVYSEDTLVILKHSGQIVETLPVADQKKILDLHLGSTTHHYLLSHFTLETHDLSKKKTTYRNFHIPATRAPSHFSIQKNLAAFLINGTPYVYKL